MIERFTEPGRLAIAVAVGIARYFHHDRLIVKLKDGARTKLSGRPRLGTRPQGADGAVKGDLALHALRAGVRFRHRREDSSRSSGRRTSINCNCTPSARPVLPPVMPIRRVIPTPRIGVVVHASVVAGTDPDERRWGGDCDRWRLGCHHTASDCEGGATPAVPVFRVLLDWRSFPTVKSLPPHHWCHPDFGSVWWSLLHRPAARYIDRVLKGLSPGISPSSGRSQALALARARSARRTPEHSTRTMTKIIAVPMG